MARQSRGMTPEELVHHLVATGLSLFAAILLVLAVAAVLETVATR